MRRLERALAKLHRPVLWDGQSTHYAHWSRQVSGGLYRSSVQGDAVPLQSDAIGDERPSDRQGAVPLHAEAAVLGLLLDERYGKRLLPERPIPDRRPHGLFRDAARAVRASNELCRARSVSRGGSKRSALYQPRLLGKARDRSLGRRRSRRLAALSDCGGNTLEVRQQGRVLGTDLFVSFWEEAL